jgi:peptidyl-prolyl cis-trans isomerase D
VKFQKLAIKIVTVVLFGLLILSFGIWGIGDIFRNVRQSDPVAEVGNTQISQQDFSRTLSREMNRLSNRLNRRFDIEQARTMGVVDQVLGQMIGRALFEQKATDMKLVVSDALVKKQIAEEPAFRNSLGQFDPNRFVQTLQLSNLSESEYVDSLRHDILRKQIIDALTDAATAPQALANTFYAYRAEKRVAKILKVPNASIKDLPEPDEAALEAFHKEFSSRFMAPEYRALTLVQLRAEDLAAEVKVTDEEIKKEFDSRREDFAVPERRRIEQMVLPDEAAAKAAYAKLKDAGSFAAVAKDATGQAPIELGLVAKDDLPADIADPAFALAQGAISEPIKSSLGWHILRVTEIQPAHQPNLAEVHDELKHDIAMRQATDSMVSIANHMDDELAGGATLDEAATSLNLPIRKIDSIDRDGKDKQGNNVEIKSRDQVIKTAWETDSGETSLLTETDAGGYFILRVDGVTPAQLRPLGEVRDKVVELWRESQRAARAREKAAALAEQARNGKSLEALAKADGYEVTTSEPITRFQSDASRGIPPALASKLFELKPGEIGTVVAPDGHLVVQLEKVQPANLSADAAQVKTLRESLQSAMRADLLEQFATALRTEYGTQINQRVVDNVLAGF